MLTIENLTKEDVYKIILLRERHLKGLKQGYDMHGPLDCDCECIWQSKLYKDMCPQGGCKGFKIQETI